MAQIFACSLQVCLGSSVLVLAISGGGLLRVLLFVIVIWCIGCILGLSAVNLLVDIMMGRMKCDEVVSIVEN